MTPDLAAADFSAPEPPAEVVGWRIYSVSEDGRLLPPWAGRIWSDLLQSADVVADGQPARCLALPHPAPAPGCTCGYRATEDRAALVRYGLGRHPTHWPIGMLPACGVLAQVRLYGRLQPGHAMPRDDPPTTWRGSHLELLHLYVGAVEWNQLAPLQRYGCEVTRHDGHWSTVRVSTVVDTRTAPTSSG